MGVNHDIERHEEVGDEDEHREVEAHESRETDACEHDELGDDIKGVVEVEAIERSLAMADTRECAV